MLTDRQTAEGKLQAWCGGPRPPALPGVPGGFSSYLGHERGAEAALVVVGGGDALHHARHWVVGVAGPAATRRHVEDLSQQLGVQTQPGGQRGGCGGQRLIKSLIS